MAQEIYEIPLDPRPQSFTIALAGVEYQLNLAWNFYSNSWSLDISTPDGVPILAGIPLVSGADLLEQYAYMNFGGSLVVQSDSDLYAIPGYDTLGETDHLYFLVEA